MSFGVEPEGRLAIDNSEKHRTQEGKGVPEANGVGRQTRGSGQGEGGKNGECGLGP